MTIHFDRFVLYGSREVDEPAPLSCTAEFVLRAPAGKRIALVSAWFSVSARLPPGVEAEVRSNVSVGARIIDKQSHQFRGPVGRDADADIGAVDLIHSPAPVWSACGGTYRLGFYSTIALRQSADSLGSASLVQIGETNFSVRSRAGGITADVLVEDCSSTGEITK